MSSESGRRLPRPGSVLRAAIAGVFALLLASLVANAAFGVDCAGLLQLLPGCPFRAATGAPCPGCGMTRAFLLLSQLRVGEAFAVHPASPFLALAMAVQLVRPQGWPQRYREPLAAGLLVLVVGGWIGRSVAG